MNLPVNQVTALHAVAAANPNLVVVMVNGSTVVLGDVGPYARALVEAWLGGQAAGGAIADVLSGAVNPSGRLAETVPHRLADNSSYLNFPGDSRTVRYGEGLFIGYRGYDAAALDVAFPFGFGLSYTTFAVSDLGVAVSGSVQQGDLTAQVTVTVANTGAVAGAEVVQVYVRDVEASVARPVRELKGFVKVSLETLETTAPGVYCIGDVAGPPMLAHKGSREGVVVAERVAGHKPHPIRYDNVPSVTYCHPEVASIGMTEEQAKEKKLDYQVGRFPFSANGRARTAGETEGFVKIIRDKKYGEILGAHIVGGHASEIIHELAVARENEYTVEEVDLAIHAHPTLSEAIAEAALDSMGRVVHI